MPMANKAVPLPLMRKVVADPDKVDYIRKRVYTHNARLAATFRAGRILLAGDASPDELRHAEYYLADAEAFIAATAPTH